MIQRRFSCTKTSVSVFFIFALSFPTYKSVHACSYNGPFFTLSQRTADANVILEGTVWHFDTWATVKNNAYDSSGRGGLAVYVIVNQPNVQLLGRYQVI